MAYDSSGNFQNSITVTLGVGPFNNLGESTLQQYLKPSGVTLTYISGATNRLVITPASGGSTINSLDASGCSDGFTMLIVNASATDPIIFNHLGGGLASNQFTNGNSVAVQILPNGAARCTYVINSWRFA